MKLQRRLSSLRDSLLDLSDLYCRIDCQEVELVGLKSYLVASNYMSLSEERHMTAIKRFAVDCRPVLDEPELMRKLNEVRAARIEANEGQLVKGLKYVGGTAERLIAEMVDSVIKTLYYLNTQSFLMEKVHGNKWNIKDIVYSNTGT